MNIIKVETNEKMEQVVSGRDLHEKLEIGTPFKKWIDRMCDYGFVENTDFVTVDKNVYGQNGQLMPQKEVEYILTLEMAKQLCMLARNEKGMEFRRYFVEVEKAWNNPEQVMARALDIAKRTIETCKQDISKLTLENKKKDEVITVATNSLLGIEHETSRKNINSLVKSLSTSYCEIHKINPTSNVSDVYMAIYKDFCKYANINFREIQESRIQYKKKDPKTPLSTKKSYIQVIEERGLATLLLNYLRDVKIENIGER